MPPGAMTLLEQYAYAIVRRAYSSRMMRLCVKGKALTSGESFGVSR